LAGGIEDPSPVDMSTRLQKATTLHNYIFTTVSVFSIASDLFMKMFTSSFKSEGDESIPLTKIALEILRARSITGIAAQFCTIVNVQQAV
jgi:hypothetical protein